MKTSRLALLALSLTAFIAHPGHAERPSLAVIELGNLGEGKELKALAVNDSGVVVGDAPIHRYEGPSHAFRWTKAGGMVDLGTLGGDGSIALGVSADGIVVGRSETPDNPVNPDSHAFRWTKATGIVDLGTLGGASSIAAGISRGGDVVVGLARPTGDSLLYHAFRWTQATGMTDLGTLGGMYSYANAVSADGGVVVGHSKVTRDSRYLDFSAYHAFRWTQATGMMDLGTLGGEFSFATAVSADGSVVVGEAGIPSDSDSRGSTSHAFRWTKAGGMVDLGALGDIGSKANGVSADGSVVVGETDTPYGKHAFLWTAERGMQDLNTLLENAGVDMTRITLQAAYGISPNGRYIVGEGQFPDSNSAAFIVCYDAGKDCSGAPTGTAP